MTSKKLVSLAREHLDRFWPEVKPFLEKGLLSTEGEITIDQLRLLIVQGHIHVVLFQTEDYETVGALAFEIQAYPNFRVANIVSFGGEQLLVDEAEMVQFSAGLRKMGVTKIQGWCSPAVSRLWRKQFKATTPYTMIRIELEGE